MKTPFKITITLLAFGTILLGGLRGHAQSTITLNPGAGWIGFMNVFNLPSAGGGYQFGSGWGPSDLSAIFSGSTLTLGPNTIGDPDPYWYTPSGGPGAIGNKVMDASMYVETASGLYSGQTLTFTCDVLANTLAGQVAPNGVAWTTVAFIKDFAPDYSSFVSQTVALTPGTFSISLATINDPSRHIQYGFETIGSDVWITDVAGFGTAVIAPVPEPSSLALTALGGLGTLVIFRRRCRL